MPRYWKPFCKSDICEIFRKIQNSDNAIHDSTIHEPMPAYRDDGKSEATVTYPLFQNGGSRGSFVVNFVDHVQIQKIYHDSINLNSVGFLKQ